MGFVRLLKPWKLCISLYLTFFNTAFTLIANQILAFFLDAYVKSASIADYLSSHSQPIYISYIYRHPIKTDQQLTSDLPTGRTYHIWPNIDKHDLE